MFLKRVRAEKKVSDLYIISFSLHNMQPPIFNGHFCVLLLPALSLTIIPTGPLCGVEYSEKFK